MDEDAIMDDELEAADEAVAAMSAGTVAGLAADGRRPRHSEPPITGACWMPGCELPARRDGLCVAHLVVLVRGAADERAVAAQIVREHHGKREQAMAIHVTETELKRLGLEPDPATPDVARPIRPALAATPKHDPAPDGPRQTGDHVMAKATETNKCRVPACDGVAKFRGVCMHHYQRYQRLRYGGKDTAEVERHMLSSSTAKGHRGGPQLPAKTSRPTAASALPRGEVLARRPVGNGQLVTADDVATMPEDPIERLLAIARGPWASADHNGGRLIVSPDVPHAVWIGADHVPHNARVVIE